MTPNATTLEGAHHPTSGAKLKVVCGPCGQFDQALGGYECCSKRVLLGNDLGSRYIREWKNRFVRPLWLAVALQPSAWFSKPYDKILRSKLRRQLNAARLAMLGFRKQAPAEIGEPRSQQPLSMTSLARRHGERAVMLKDWIPQPQHHIAGT